MDAASGAVHAGKERRMSILIKGINVHRGRCYECPCLDGEYGDCKALKKDVHYITKEDCPLIELLDHGDLIEREAAYDSIAEQEGGNYIDMDAVYVGLHNAPPVIPADKEEE